MAIGYQNIIARQTEISVAPGIVSAEDRREIQIEKKPLTLIRRLRGSARARKASFTGYE